MKTKRAKSPFAYKIAGNKVVLPALSTKPEGSEDWKSVQEEERRKEEAAKRLFDLILDPIQLGDFSDPQRVEKHFARLDSRRKAIDQSITENLNHQTIGYFLKMVLANGRHSYGKFGGGGLHQHNIGAKPDYFRWFDDNKSKFGRNMSEAATQAIKAKLSTHAHRTVYAWALEWGKLQSTK